MKTNADEWVRNHDMPHEYIMDFFGIEIADLELTIQSDIIEFDKLFKKALSDGYVDDKEQDKLVADSYRIAQKIKNKYGDEHSSDKDKGVGGGLAILAGIGIAIGAAFGIKNLKL